MLFSFSRTTPGSTSFARLGIVGAVVVASLAVTGCGGTANAGSATTCNSFLGMNENGRIAAVTAMMKSHNLSTDGASVAETVGSATAYCALNSASATIAGIYGGGSSSGGNSQSAPAATTTTLPPDCQSGSGGSSAPFAAAFNTDPPTLSAVISALKSVAAQVPVARQIVKQIGGESPPAASAAEAFGRLRFSHVDIDTEVKNLDSAYSNLCGGPLFGSSAQSDLAGLTPAPASGGGVTAGSNVYGTSCNLGEVQPPFTFVYTCGQSVTSVDGTTGVPTTSPAFLPDTSNNNSSSSNGPSSTVEGPSYAGNDIVWTSLDVVPAAGLTSPTWSATLHVRDLAGNVVADVPVVPSQPELSGQPGKVHLTYAGPRAVLVQTEAATANSYTDQWFTPAGAPLSNDTSNAGRYSNVATVTDNLVDVNANGELYNISTRTLSAPEGSGGTNYTDGGCGVNALLTGQDGNGNQVLLRAVDGSAGPVLTPAPAALVQTADGSNLNVKGVFPEGVAARASDGTLYFTNWDGTAAWNLTSQVVSSVRAVGAWLAIKNQSGQWVLVDPSTGKQTAAPSPAVNALLVAGASNTFNIDSANAAGNTAVVDDGTVYTQLAYTDVCR